MKMESCFDAVMEYIDTHGLQSREPLPNAPVFAQALGVPIALMEESLKEGERDGSFYRASDGALVLAPPRILRDMYKMNSSSTSILRQGHTMTSVVLYARVTEAAKEEASALNLPLGTHVFHLSRVRSVDGEPSMLEISYLPDRLFPGLSEYDFAAHSLYAVLRERYHCIAATQEQEFVVSLPTPEEARLLHIFPDDPLMVQLGRTGDEKGHIFEYSISKAVSRCFEFGVTMEFTKG